MEKQNKKQSKVIIREEEGVRYMEIKLSKRLEKEMRKLVEKTAGTIPV